MSSLAITMLLIITTAVTISGESVCGPTGPVLSGACKDDYANCVSNVITYLRDRTPSTKDEALTTYYPDDESSGVVWGFAACITGTKKTDCQSCLVAAKEWLDQNCASSANAIYYGGICGMRYGQQFV
ncbi:hypothetical protein LINPERPRIM_LOCUS23456 [Linum perenne]